jgi:hypothetical protein
MKEPANGGQTQTVCSPYTRAAFTGLTAKASLWLSQNVGGRHGSECARESEDATDLVPEAQSHRRARGMPRVPRSTSDASQPLESGGENSPEPRRVRDEDCRPFLLSPPPRGVPGKTATTPPGEPEAARKIPAT